MALLIINGSECSRSGIFRLTLPAEFLSVSTTFHLEELELDAHTS